MHWVNCGWCKGAIEFEVCYDYCLTIASFDHYLKVCRKEKIDHMNIIMKPRTLVTSVLHCRFHDNIHVIKFSFLQGWLLSNDDPNKLQVWMEGSECSVSDEYVRNIKTCLVVFFVLWLYWVLNLKKKYGACI